MRVRLEELNREIVSEVVKRIKTKQTCTYQSHGLGLQPRGKIDEHWTGAVGVDTSWQVLGYLGVLVSAWLQ